MAKILNKDPITYDRERDGFIRELRHFHDTRGTPFRKIPKINGHEIDLYLLYVLVTAHGGWVKVNSRNEWESLVEQFNLPTQCVNSGVGIKQIYLRYLDRYEKVHFLGEDGERGSDDDEESRHKRWSARALHSVPLTYNYHQHNIAEGVRAYNGLSSNLFKPTDYDRLTLSLISPLPNEQDFAINVCMLLSNEGKHTLRLDKCPRLLDLLLAHAGVFNHVSLRELFHEIYGKIRNHSMHQFWYDTLADDVSDLTDERRFPTDGRPSSRPKPRLRSPRATPSTSKAASRAPSIDTVSEAATESVPDEPVFEEGDDGLLGESRPRLKIEASDYELFCVGRSFGTQDYLGQRVLQIGTVLRNLSFSEENVAVLSKSVTYLRFLLLCVNSRWNTLHQLGLDMLGNIAMDVLVVDPLNDRLAGCLVSTITKGISSQDRSVVVSCLEVLNKLSQKDENEEVMLRCIEQQVYDQICRFLTLHDIMLLIQTLECLYSLSSLGERACNCIVRVHGCIDTLVALITVEAQSYGPKACILMRVVETAASGAPAVASTPNLSTPSPVTPIRAANPPPPPPPIKTPVIAPQPPTQMLVAKGGGPVATAVATPVSTTQAAQHAAQQAAQENEQFALSWLRAACEPCSTARIAQAELYRQYQAACARIGRRGLVQPLHFPRCVRSVFGGSVGPSLSKAGAASADNVPHYEGIKVRAHFLRNSMSSPAPTPAPTPAPATVVEEPAVPQPSSPILKAQLSAPPKPTKPGAATAAEKGQVGSHPHLTQALLGATGAATETPKETPSSLIKSLLASKVNAGGDGCMASMLPVPCAVANTTTAAAVAEAESKVTQRQQRLLQQQQQLKNNVTPVANSVAKKPIPKPVEVKPKPPPPRINGLKPGVDCPREVVVDNGPTELTPSAHPLGNGALPHRQVPPLAPLSSGPQHVRTDGEADETAKANNVGSEDGAMKALLNGIPAAEDPTRSGKPASKSLMLADLLEKKVDARKDHPILNGVLGKELRIGDKGLELVENHLDKVLKETACYQPNKDTVIQYTNHSTAPAEEAEQRNALKRPAEDDPAPPAVEAKRPHVDTNGRSDEATSASAAAANLYAAFAASALEDEPEMEMTEEQLVVANQQQLIVTSNNRQMFVSPPQSQVLITPAGQITLHAAPGPKPGPAQVQNIRPQLGAQMVQGQVVLTQGQGGQLILSQAPQGAMQLGQATYMVAQQPQGIGQGHQTVLVTQTQQQQGTGAKTLIIFQNPGGNGGSGAQKMVVSSTAPPQGQPVVVTQVPRPIVQSPAISTPPPALVPASPKPAQPAQPAQPQLRPSTPSTPLGAIKEPAEPPPVTSPPPQPSPLATQLKSGAPVDPNAFLCEWRGCMRSFKSANETYMHACESHCPSGSQEIQCLWERCDAMKRKRFSLMTHLYDRHCNTEVLKMMAVRRKQLSLSGRSEIPPPAPPPPHPGYAPNAAFHAIKRHALEFVNPKELMRPVKPAAVPLARAPPEQDDNEGPVTKSIRLTSSLILRNLVIYSTNGRRFLRSYEPHLASIALSNVESSRTIAQVLYDMNQAAGAR